MRPVGSVHSASMAINASADGMAAGSPKRPATLDIWASEYQTSSELTPRPACLSSGPNATAGGGFPADTASKTAHR